MTTKQLQALMDAGFTAEQIVTISKGFQTPGPAGVETPTTETDQGKGSEQKTPEVPQENETQTMLKEMLGLMRTGFINNLSTNPQPEKTGSDVLAEILNPSN